MFSRKSAYSTLCLDFILVQYLDNMHTKVYAGSIVKERLSVVLAYLSFPSHICFPFWFAANVIGGIFI